MGNDNNSFEEQFGIHAGDGLQTKTWHHIYGGGSFRCTLCGEVVGRRDCVSTTLFDGQTHLGDLCVECIKAGPVQVAERIRKFATDLRQEAQGLDDLAERLPKLDLTKWSSLEDPRGSLARLKEKHNG